MWSRPKALVSISDTRRSHAHFWIYISFYFDTHEHFQFSSSTVALEKETICMALLRLPLHKNQFISKTTVQRDERQTQWLLRLHTEDTNIRTHAHLLTCGGESILIYGLIIVSRAFSLAESTINPHRGTVFVATPSTLFLPPVIIKPSTFGRPSKHKTRYYWPSFLKVVWQRASFSDIFTPACFRTRLGS